MKQRHNEDKFGFIFESALSALIDSFSEKAKDHVDGKIASLRNSANNYIDGAGTVDDGTFDDAKKIVQDAAKEILDVVTEPLRDNAKIKIAEVTEWMQTNGKDLLKNTFTGRLTIQEWALVAITGVDKVKEQILNEGELRFIGGNLKFAMDLQERDKVVVAFELYFFDESEKWIKASAFSTFSTMKFTSEALEEINSKGKVVFEVE